MINYISNIDVKNISGGWSGMNHFIFKQLSKRYDVHLADKIDPPYNLFDRIKSKASRLIFGRGIFPAFTAERLSRIANLSYKMMRKDVDLTFFHGATPWLNVVPNTPYAAYLDACFGTYIDVYHTRDLFSKSQLNSLYKKERDFLSSAEAVFFSSAWAMNDTKSRYDMPGPNFHVAGLGGGIDIYIGPKVQSEKYFLFAGLDFFGKGGDKVVAAFNTLHQKYPECYLKIVGQRPPDRMLSHPHIKYEGLIDKNTTEGHAKLAALFSNAYCFLLPTSRDMTPLVLVEAAAAGCPAISTRRFGIPEIVLDEVTGILLNENGSRIVEELAEAMELLAADERLTKNLSEKAREHATQNLTWNKVGERISAVLESCTNIIPAYA